MRLADYMNNQTKLNENVEFDSNEFNINISGDFIQLYIENYGDRTGIINLKLKGKKILKIKPFETVSYEYTDENTETLRKMYQKVFEVHGKNMKKIVEKFESELKKEIQQIERKLGKL